MQQSLKKRLLQYGASIPVLLGAQVAQGQIILHHANPALIGTEDMPALLDFNDDGEVDLSFYFTNQHYLLGNSYGIWAYDQNKLLANPGVGNVVVSPESDYYPYYDFQGVRALDAYFLVSASATWYNIDSFVLLSWRSNCYNISPETNGYWNKDYDTAYLAVQLYFDSDFHYGWVRLNVNKQDRTYTITDYAVNMMPDAPIYTGLSDVNYTLEAFSADNRLYVFAPPAYLNRTMQLRITDLNGRVLINEPVLVEEHLQFALPELSNGQYIVTLSDDMFISSVPFFYVKP